MPLLHEDEPPPAPGRFLRVPIPGSKRLRALRDSLGPAAFREVLKINRVDLAHVRAGDSLVIPAPDAAFDSLRYAPFPRKLARVDSLEKFLLVSLRMQAFGAYERGRLIRWGPTSSGKKQTPTPARLYHVNWKDRERVSTIDEEWLLTWYINLDNLDGISLHQYGMPGYAASHSCLRLLEEDARWLYAWVEQWRLTSDGARVTRNGTPVLVFGAYGYGRRRPWRRLPEDPLATNVTAQDVEAALASIRLVETVPLLAEQADSVAIVDHSQPVSE